LQQPYVATWRLCKRGWVVALEWILQHGLKLIDSAADNGHVEFVRELLSRDARMNIQD
jgi:hypothetical protein